MTGRFEFDWNDAERASEAPQRWAQLAQMTDQDWRRTDGTDDDWRFGAKRPQGAVRHGDHRSGRVERANFIATVGVRATRRRSGLDFGGRAEAAGGEGKYAVSF